MNRTIPRVSTFSLPLLAFFIRYTSRINRWPLQQAGDAREFNPAFDSDFESRGISFRFPSFGKRERIFSPTFEKLSLYLYVFYYRYYFFPPTAVSRSFEHLLIEKKMATENENHWEIRNSTIGGTSYMNFTLC